MRSILPILYFILLPCTNNKKVNSFFSHFCFEVFISWGLILLFNSILNIILNKFTNLCTCSNYVVAQRSDSIQLFV